MQQCFPQSATRAQCHASKGYRRRWNGKEGIRRKAVVNAKENASYAVLFFSESHADSLSSTTFYDIPPPFPRTVS